MGIDIAALTAEQKLELAGAIGSVVLAHGTVTDAVSHLDIALPAGYSKFVLYINDWTVSAQNLVGVVSTDDGATFYCDSTNYDTYGVSGWVMNKGSMAITPWVKPLDDSLIDFNWVVENGDSMIEIMPGAAGKSMRLMARSQQMKADQSALAVSDTFAYIDVNATITPTLARINLIRLQPYGNGDTPPTSEDTITGGSYSLMGIK